MNGLSVVLGVDLALIMARHGSLTLIAELPTLQSLVQEEVIKFVDKWRSHFGRQTAGPDTQLIFKQNAISAGMLVPLRTFLAASFTTGDQAQRDQRAIELTSYLPLPANVNATQYKAWAERSMAVDDQLLRELEQYYRRAGTDSLLRSLQKACIFPTQATVRSYSDALTAYATLVSKALVDCCPVNGEQSIEAAMGNEPHKAYVKAIISGFPEQQRRSWQTAFDTNAYPTVQSLLRAIMQESTRIHSNFDKLQEQTDFEAREPRHAGSKNEGGGRGSGKWSRKGGKSKGRGGGKSADVEPYFKGKCDNCGAHGHKAISCRQPVRQTWQSGQDVRGGKKDSTRDYAKGKIGKKGLGQRKGEKPGKKGKKGKFGRDASFADGASAEMPAVAAAMQPGALVKYGQDGESYDAVFGDGESTLRNGGGQPTYPRWDTYGSYDAGGWHEPPHEYDDWGNGWSSESAQGNAWHANGSHEDSSAWQDGSDWHDSSSWDWY